MQWPQHGQPGPPVMQMGGQTGAQPYGAQPPPGYVHQNGGGPQPFYYGSPYQAQATPVQQPAVPFGSYPGQYQQQQQQGPPQMPVYHHPQQQPGYAQPAPFASPSYSWPGQVPQQQQQQQLPPLHYAHQGFYPGPEHQQQQQMQQQIPQQNGFIGAPSIFNDPNAFRMHYQALLRNLTFNSKPLINEGTQLARDNIHMSHIISSCLDEHLKTVTQDVKLPALYLLDSISKNIGSVYPDQFSRFVERVFLTAFQDADQSMQVKLEELLGTWRTGGRNGSELFAPGVYQSIANNVASIRGTDESDGQQPATPGERAGALYDIRRLLVKRQEEALTSPQDETIATQIMILTQLEGLVKVQQLTSAQIIAIHDQIATLSPVTAEDGITPQIAEIAVSADGENLPDLAALSSLMDPDLLRQALGSGWNAAAPAKPLVTKIDPIEDRYQSMLLSFEISLTTSDIQRYRPDAPALIYDELPEACKQCGTRFLSGDNGSRKMQSHLDWHFRRNKRLLEKARPQSRSWLIMSEEWLAPPGQIKTEETQLVEEDEEEPLDPEKCIVKVTESTGTRSRACPICQETIETKLTDEEDYIWTNAVQVGGKIYHATCHAEMTKARRLAKVEDDYDAYDETKPEQQLSVNRVAIDAEDSVLPPLKEEDESAAALLLSPVAPSLDPPSSSNHSRASSESPSAQTQSPSRASSPSLAEPSRSADAAPIAASDGAESAGLRAAQEPSDALAVTAGEIEDELDYTAASSDDDAALYDDTGAASSLAGKRRISPSAGSTEPKRARQEES